MTLVPGTHDESLHPAGPGTPRANVTSVIKWLNGGTSPTTTYSYDKTGHVISSTDACGNPNGGCADVNGSSHTTQYFYADAYTTLSAGQNVNYTPTNGATNALLTKIIDPLLHVATFKYDYTSSQLTSATDPNSQTTGYIYNDFFARPTQVNLPDGGQTSVAYVDSAYNPSLNTPSVTTTKMITSGLNEVNIAAGDGLGHVVRAILNSDPDGADTTDTTYDGFGRALTQTNPYRSGASPTDGTTTTTYDALGRTTSVLRPDNSAVSTTYDQINGNTVCTTVSDETGKSRKSCSDGFGRLVQVFEDPLGVNYETDYAYDILGNLLTVNQKGTAPTNSTQWRTRSFTYDSLSRLLTASNPESGTIRYTYDANGNVASKIAPQPNQTGSATVTTNYSYDVLNRLLGKSYVGMSTAGATYGYDGTAPTGCTPPSLADSYPIGRRTGMCDGSGSASWSHDKMGRVLTESQKVNGFTRNISYTYNLDGSLATLTYPSGRVVSYTPGGAGRPTAVADSTGPINYAQAVHYAPFGGLTDMTQGVTPITIKNRYSPRLQPVLLSAFTSSATIMSVCYDFHSKIALPSTNFAPCSFSASSLGDNDNVYQIVNNRDSNRTQNFMYDSLNRIQQAYSSGPNWGETYSSTATTPGVVPPTSGIDAWGNMTNHVGVTGKTNTEGTFGCPASANNQLLSCGLNYDAAGNVMSNNGVIYTYDAENRLVTPGANNGTYLYDGDGNRMARLFSSSGTEYWRDLSGNTLLEDSNTGVNLREYIYFNGKKIARRDVVTNNVHYVFSDHLGSTSLMTDALGTMATCNGYVSGQFESDYYPYGGEMSICNNLGDQNYKFTGKERDAESGLDNFGKRYFGSSLGRFQTPDPIFITKHRLIDPQQWNLYSYVRNNPINLTDPTGLDFNLSCDKNNGTTCQGGQVYYKDKNGDYQKTVIKSDKEGNLTDQSGNKYKGTFDGKTVTFADAKGNTSAGSWIQGSNQTSGITGGGKLDNRFSFTFENHGEHQQLNALWSFRGSVAQAEEAWKQAGFTPRSLGENSGFDEFRSPAKDRSSGHVNVDQVPFEPKSGDPTTFGNVHTGEYDPGENLTRHTVCDWMGLC